MTPPTEPPHSGTAAPSKSGATILVTGALGLVGEAVTRLLRVAGVDVLAVDRVSGDGVLACDVTDIHRLHGLALAHDLGAAIHCAAFSGPMVSADNPPAIASVNIIGTVNVLEIARLHGLCRVVYCSSISAIGPTDAFSDGRLILAPTSVYGASKAACEHLLEGYRLEHGVDSISLRFPAIYGPRRQTDCSIRAMLLDAKAGRPTRFSTGADFPTQYIHADDAARALITALGAEAPPRRAYMVTGGQFMPLADVVALVRKVVPSADIEIGPGMHPSYEAQAEFDNEPARQDLGFSPQITLEQGIRDTWRALGAGR